MKIRTLIVDDEPLARQGLALLLARDPEIEIIGESADGAAALLAIRHLHPDLGILAPAERPIVVFVTAYDQYAIRAFTACAIDYLLKPFSDDRFAQALARAKGEWKKSRTADVGAQVEALLAYVRTLTGSAPSVPAAGAPGAPAPARAEYAERIVVKSGGDLHFVKTSDVLWLEAQGDFVKVQTTGQPQLVRETLQSMEQKLDGGRFVRIHRSFLVNVEHIRRVAPALYGDHTVFMSDGSKLRLSRSYRGKMKALTGQPPA